MYEDASSAMRDEHKAEVEKVLGELGVEDKPRIEVLNKMRSVAGDGARGAGRPGGCDIAISAKTGDGVAELLARMDAALSADPHRDACDGGSAERGRRTGSTRCGRAYRASAHSRAVTCAMVVAGPASLLGRYRRFWTSTVQTRRGADKNMDA